MDRSNRAEFVISFVASWIGQTHPDVGDALAQAAGIKYREAITQAPF
ncbi:MAG: hypothetical protein V4801_10280 [Burkholderia gladioli]